MKNKSHEKIYQKYFLNFYFYKMEQLRCPGKQSLMDATKKFEQHKIYKIVAVNKVTTTYGDNYILQDDKFNKYWANTKIKNFIACNPNKTEFRIRTGKYKHFVKDDKDITYLEMIIYQ